MPTSRLSRSRSTTRCSCPSTRDAARAMHARERRCRAVRVRTPGIRRRRARAYGAEIVSVRAPSGDQRRGVHRRALQRQQAAVRARRPAAACFLPSPGPALLRRAARPQYPPPPHHPPLVLSLSLVSASSPLCLPSHTILTPPCLPTACAAWHQHLQQLPATQHSSANQRAQAGTAGRGKNESKIRAKKGLNGRWGAERNGSNRLRHGVAVWRSRPGAQVWVGG